MYLVLTAMLALNVSADILNGFTKLRHSMESSMISTTERTSDIMTMFEAAYSMDESSKAKYGEWWTIAQAIHNKSDEFYNYIETFKLDIATMCDGPKEPYTKMPEKMTGGSDTNKPHKYALVESDPETGKLRGIALKERMEEFRYYMTTAESGIIREKIDNDAKFKHDWDLKTDMYGSLFSTSRVWDDHEKDSIAWENSVFHEMPADAVVALLTKYQNDIRVAENDMINFMFAQTSSSKFVANKVEAVIIAQNGEYIMQGDRYIADVYSAMVDTNQRPRVFIGGVELENGHFEVAATSPGEHAINGYMLVGDDTTHYPVMGKYTVGVPSAVISNTELNVMYKGYDNVFSVSVPGVNPDKLTVKCGGNTIARSAKGWIIRPSGTADMVVEVYADGKLMAKQPFRVKPLPDPAPYYAADKDYRDDKITRKALFDGAARVEVGYGKDALVQPKFKVNSFAVKLPSGVESKVTGDKLDAKTIKSLKQLKAGQSIFIRNISVTGPDGTRVISTPILLELK